MKQKLISKLKRVALALFAALCVGNVWGHDWPGDLYIGDSTCGFDIDTKTLSFSRDFCAIVKGTYSIICSYSYESNGQTYSGSGRVEKLIAADEVFGASKVLWPTLTKNFELSEFSLGDVVTATVKFQRKTADGGWEDFTTFGEHNNELTYVFDTRGVLTSECYWDVDSKKFMVSGKTSGGDDIKGVKIEYVVGNAAVTSLPATAETAQDVTYNTATGEYEALIPYVNEGSVLSWSVYALVNEDGESSEKIYTDPASQLTVLSKEQGEGAYITYTWVGNSNDNLWSSPQNWEEDKKQSLKGVPGYVNNSGYYTSTACFTNSATVNLDGKTFRLWDYEGNNVSPRGLQLVKPLDKDEMTVTFTNGTVRIDNAEDGSHSNPLLGGAGITVEFADGGIYGYSGNLAFAPGTTIIFSGNSTQPWKYNPANKGEGATTFIVRNGNVVSSYSADGDASATHTAIIENGVWMINEVVSRGIANVTKFVDGENQAKIALGENVNGKTKTLKLTGTFEFTFSENQMSNGAYILPHSLVDGSQNATFKIDATAYKSGTKVPMVEAETATAFIPSLVVMANGVDVKSARNAKLEWEGNTLYYKQDSQNAALIGSIEYPTLGAALEAATDGATIKVLNDVEITSYLQITKSLTLNLNGKSITRTDSTDNSTALFVNAADAIVTITGDGTVTADHAVYVNAGKVVIENGTFSAGSHAVYVINNGNAEIKGGTFSSEAGQYHYALNEYDQTRDVTSIVVTGGTFVGFNPANNTAEGDNTNFCADGYTAVAGEEEGTWVVQKAISELKPGVPVTNISATTEEDAIRKVKLTVKVPADANVTKDDYANYFKLVATETSEGSGVWEVAAVLDDAKVTPVIAATTDENGVVTPAITFEDGNVTVNIKNELPGLYYGVRYATTVEAVETTAPVKGFTVTPAEGDTAGFFKVVVDFKEIK